MLWSHILSDQKGDEPVRLLGTEDFDRENKMLDQEQTDMFIRLARSLPKLACLNLTGCIYDNQLFSSLLRLKHLRHLNMGVSSQVLLQQLDNRCPSLVTFNLSGQAGLRSLGLKNLVSWCPALESLHMDFCNDLDNAGLLILAQGLPRLRSLDVSDSTAVSPSGILRFAELRAPEVRRLKLKFVSRMDLVALLHNRQPFLQNWRLMSFCMRLRRRK